MFDRLFLTLERQDQGRGPKSKMCKNHIQSSTSERSY